MKKTYVKPEVYFESFELSTSIAMGCGMRINQAEGTCSTIPGIGTVFTVSDSCDWTASTDPNDQARFCYHQPLDANRIFTS